MPPIPRPRALNFSCAVPWGSCLYSIKSSVPERSKTSICRDRGDGCQEQSATLPRKLPAKPVLFSLYLYRHSHGIAQFAMRYKPKDNTKNASSVKEPPHNLLIRSEQAASAVLIRPAPALKPVRVLHIQHQKLPDFLVGQPFLTVQLIQLAELRQ